jgi:hypothetical protein
VVGSFVYVAGFLPLRSALCRPEPIGADCQLENYSDAFLALLVGPLFAMLLGAIGGGLRRTARRRRGAAG